MVCDEFFLINMFYKFYISVILIFISIFISYLFYINSKLLRMEEEEVKG